MSQHFRIINLIVSIMILIVLFIIIVMNGCSSNNVNMPEGSVMYRLTFEATWSALTHPTDFPGNPHFSGLIGASHGPSARLWEEGQTASAGIKSMAETGSKNPLNSEIDGLIADGSACYKISGGGIQTSPGVMTVTFMVNRDCSEVSVVSMIAPSPDWFVGVSGLDLREDGSWIEEKIVLLFPYDAGTDSGATYISMNQPMDIPEAIFLIKSDPFLSEGNVAPLGLFTFTLLDN